MKPYIEIYEVSEWPIRTAVLISEKIFSILKLHGQCSVMLTGGSSAALVYKALSGMHKFHLMTNVSFYFGDERCVSLDSLDSNHNLVMSTLFCRGIPTGCTLTPFEVNQVDSNMAALSYQAVIPNAVDVLLLSLGEDGHVASLFPGHWACKERVKSVVHIFGPKAPNNRLTITPKVIKNAHNIFLFARGGIKGEILSRALLKKIPDDFPVRFTLDGTWILDSDAAQEISNFNR